MFKKLRASHSTASLPNQQQQQQSDDKFDKNIFRQKREKDTRIKSLAQTKQNRNTSLSNSTNNHLRPTRRTIIFVQLDKQSSSSNSTNNHLCQTRQTIIFVQLDEQSSLSSPTNNHLCQIRRTVILVKFDKLLSQSRERIIDFPFPMD